MMDRKDWPASAPGAFSVPGKPGPAAARQTPDWLPVALRDTALTVALLAEGGTPESFASLREKCSSQITRLREELGVRQQTPDEIDDAAYAQCALLDEAALKSLQGDGHDAWEREPLQVSLFSSHDAGNELVRRIERRLREPRANTLLLGIFSAVLDLGFTGRFVLGEQKARDALMLALQKRLQAQGQPDARLGPVIVNTVTPRAGLARLSPLAWVAAAAVVLALAWLAANQWLTAAVAAMAR